MAQRRIDDDNGDVLVFSEKENDWVHIPKTWVCTAWVFRVPHGHCDLSAIGTLVGVPQETCLQTIPVFC